MSEDLTRKYPYMRFPIRCGNGCGSVIECLEAFRSYERDHIGSKLICECCAAEVGHLDEEDETPDTSPVCRRKAKQAIWQALDGHGAGIVACQLWIDAAN